MLSQIKDGNDGRLPASRLRNKSYLDHVIFPHLTIGLHFRLVFQVFHYFLEDHVVPFGLATQPQQSILLHDIEAVRPSS